MSTDKHETTGDPMLYGIDPEMLAEARRQAAEHVAHVRALKEMVKSGTATPEEEEEYDDLTWWLDHPVPALPPPEGTPNP